MPRGPEITPELTMPPVKRLAGNVDGEGRRAGEDLGTAQDGDAVARRYDGAGIDNAAADRAAVDFDAGRRRDGSGVDDAAIEVTDGIAGTESGRMKAKPYACAARRDGASIGNAACKRIGKNHDPG